MRTARTRMAGGPQPHLGAPNSWWSRQARQGKGERRTNERTRVGSATQRWERATTTTKRRRRRRRGRGRGDARSADANLKSLERTDDRAVARAGSAPE